jgi:putative phosphoribosyl transferase
MLPTQHLDLTEAQDLGWSVKVFTPSAMLDGELAVPEGATGVVLFACGSGSARHSPRNQRIATTFHAAGFGSLLLDLLTRPEEAYDLQTGELRYDVARLADRVAAAADWLAAQPETAHLPVGCFAAGTGTAVAIVASTFPGSRIRAIVSRGGRPDLAGDRLEVATVPILLIVGAIDPATAALNAEALQRLHGVADLERIPDATHRFEERGALTMVIRLACNWFGRYLSTPAAVT